MRQPVQAMADQHLVQGVEGEAEVVVADEFDAQPLEAELALTASGRDCQNFRVRAMG